MCRVKAKKENKNIQQRTLSGFITIPSINYALFWLKIAGPLSITIKEGSDDFTISEFFKLSDLLGFPERKDDDASFQKLACCKLAARVMFLLKYV